jgi:tetratricopeptide (TPR) repeat protein
MLPLSTNTPTPPLLTAEQVRQNEAFWQELKGGAFKQLAREVKLAKGKKQENVSAVLMGAIYSRAINYFAVELQKRGDLPKAREYFELALDVNPDNVAALINLDYNKLKAVGGTEAPPSEEVAKKIAVYRGSWEAVLGYNGPVDEPNSCYLLAQSFTKGHNYRQAAQLLERIEAFTPDNVSAQIALASVYVQGGRQEDALRKVTEIRTKFPKMTEDQTLTLFECEAWAQSFKGDLPAAQKILSIAERAYPNRSEPFKGMAEIYLSQGDLTNAMASLKGLIQAQPDSLDGLINYAALNIRIGKFKEAIPSLDRALLLQPENLYALLNRAIANLQLENFEAARQDYETLELHLPKPMHAVHYALGEIALRQKQKPKALKHFEKYLKLAPHGTPEMKFVEYRIQQLKSGAI